MLWYRGGRKELLERIEALEKAVEGHSSGLRLVKVEWESVLHKVNGVMGRLNARIRKNDTQEETPDVGPNPLPLPVVGSHSTLSHMRGKQHGVLPR